MKSFELFLSTPVHHYVTYFIIAFFVSFVLAILFKKDETYYVVFLSTFVLFSIFSKELLTNLPLSTCDYPNIASNLLGSLSGILVETLSRKKKEKSKRRLI